MSDRRLDPSLVDAVRAGFSRRPYALPPWLFYDAEGSRLYELLTELPEYYLTRAEHALLRAHSDEIVRAARASTTEPLVVLELGAGTFTKTQRILEAAARAQGRTVFVPVDISPTPLALGRARLERELASVRIEPLVGTFEAAWPALRALRGRRLVLFLGSSVGNLDDDAASTLLRDARRAVDPGDVFLLGADLRKDPAIMVPAYDDAQGLTAAFNRNVLTRLNRELDADFDLARFRHVALWNDAASRIEMHLESTSAQSVHLRALDWHVPFERGERIHTESCAKYDDARIERTARAAGWQLARRFTDPQGLFASYLLSAA